MIIDRQKDQGGRFEAIRRIKFCLDQLEKNGFKGKNNWSTEICKHLTLEEVVGALVSSEQAINDPASFITLTMEDAAMLNELRDKDITSASPEAQVMLQRFACTHKEELWNILFYSLNSGIIDASNCSGYEPIDKTEGDE